MKYQKFHTPLIIFLIFNLYVILFFGYYHDDWGFFVFNDQSFFDHSEDIWTTEGVLLHRYINVPFYIIGSLIPDTKLLYTYIGLIGLIIYFQIYDLLKNFLKKNNILNFKNSFGLSILIVCWYFFPFNISGQFWLTNIHVKISFFFFLLHFQLLIKDKFLYSMISLFLSLSSYEMFYLIHFPLSVLIYKSKLINKSVFKKYLIYSALIQFYFILDRMFFLPLEARPNSNEINLKYLILENFENIIRFFWSIYMSYSSVINIFWQVIIFSPIIYFFSKLYKIKIFFKIMFLLVISLVLNSAIVSGGGYGYMGQGIFSKTFYYASVFIFLFMFSIFLFLKNDFNKNIFLIYILLISFFGFYYESKSWIKSWDIQKEIYQSDMIKNFPEDKKNLVIFFGPCRYNGVEIFYAPWDLTRAIKETNPKIKSEFVPLTNWKVEIYSNKTDNNIWLGLHDRHYSFPIIDYDKIIFWDYFKKYKKVIIDNELILLNQLELNKLNSYRTCDIETEKYTKNKIDAKKYKKKFYDLFF